MNSKLVEAAPSCRALFETETVKQHQYLQASSFLDHALLAKYGFKYNPANGIIYDMNGNRPVALGKIYVQKIDNLYQWGPIADQRQQVANGGILRSEMDYILKADAQAYGRGFYVSKNPYDSSNYGEGLTVFKANGPMVFLRYNEITLNLTADQYFRLAKAGVDAIEAENNTDRTWLSVFSLRHLKVVRENETTDAYWQNFDNLKDIVSIEASLDKSLFWNKLPIDNFFRTLRSGRNINSDYLWEQLKSDSLKHIDPIAFRQSHIGKNIIKTLEKILAAKINEAPPTSLAEAQKIMTAIRLTQFKTRSNLHSRISRIFSYVDYFNVFKILSGTKMKEAKSLDEVLNFTHDTDSGLSRIDLTNINSWSDFKREASKLLQAKVETRNYDVMMSPHEDSPSDIFTVNRETYIVLESNPLLEIKRIQNIKQNSRVVYEVEIRYAQLEKFVLLADKLPLSQELKQELAAKAASISRNPDSVALRSLYKRVLDELTENIFTVNGRKAIMEFLNADAPFRRVNASDVMQLYVFYISLHPLKDGNGRTGRMLYEYLTQTLEGQAAELVLPSFDLDVFAPTHKLETFQLIGSYFREFTHKIRTETQLKNFLKLFTEAFEKQHPDEAENLN